MFAPVFLLATTKMTPRIAQERLFGGFVEEHPAEVRSRSAFLTDAALERMHKGYSFVGCCTLWLRRGPIANFR